MRSFLKACGGIGEGSKRDICDNPEIQGLGLGP